MSNCPSCGSVTSVVDSRPQKDTVRRRRACPACGHRYTTWETTINVPELQDMLRRARTGLGQAMRTLAAGLRAE